MRYAELARKLHRLGYEVRRQARGSHEVWWHPAMQKVTVVPRHEGKEISKHTLALILKDLGISQKDLDGV